MSYALPRNHGCRISDAWTYEGMRTVVLENELLRVVVLADKGSDIVEFRYKPRDLDFMLVRPPGVRNLNRGLLSSPTTGTFIDYYEGGWNDILPNGGPFSTYQGAEFGQHGEISLIPWEFTIVEDAPERVAVRMWVRPIRTPFFVEKTLSLVPGRAVLTIDERVVNEAGQPMHLMWGQHIAFGRPFLDEGAIIDAPASRFIVNDVMENYEPRRFQVRAQSAWPHAPTPDGAMADASIVPSVGAAEAQEMAYITGLNDGWYAITNPVRRVGFGVRFDPELYRYIWYWQQLGGAGKGFPWWGRLHTTALEPWTSYPTGGLSEAIANGTARRLEPGQALTSHFLAVAYEGFGRVGGITAEGDVLPASLP
jgi:galactose mutarotase-like enzyme